MVLNDVNESVSTGADGFEKKNQQNCWCGFKRKKHQMFAVRFTSLSEAMMCWQD